MTGPRYVSYVPSDWAARNARAFGSRPPHASAETQQHRHRELDQRLADHDRRLAEFDQRYDALSDKLASAEDARQDQTGQPAPAGSEGSDAGS